MTATDQNITFPVTIMSSESDQGQYFSRQMTESFSQKYSGNPAVPDVIILELAYLYQKMDGEYSFENIRATNVGFCTLCDFLIISGGGITSISEFTSADAGRFFEYCRSAHKSGGLIRYFTVRARLKSVIEINWPQATWDSEQTEGISVAASAALRDKLQEEIIRIRSKLGRLEYDLKIGNVLDIDMSASKAQKAEMLESLSSNKANIIKTIRHYIPQFPLYQENKPVQNKSYTNPGEWLLLNIRITKTSETQKILAQHFSKTEDLYDYYFPTAYDATCILMYFALVTGWNRQVIESVGCDELNLRFQRNHMMKAWSKDHVIIRGKKVRGQPIDKPKFFSHLSDINDEFGLYNVLVDFYNLTKTIRFGINPLEDRCIFMGVQLSSTRIGYFGPGVKISEFAKWNSIPSKRSPSLIDKFFTKHEIFDDADSLDPQVRIEAMSWRQFRTSYETILEDMELPLYVRQLLLGHTSIDTSMYPYGSDKHASKIQTNRLGHILTEIYDVYKHAKYFHGAFLPSLDKQHMHQRSNQKVVAIARTDWRDNLIMFCSDCKKPTWHGHERHIKPGDECFQISMCLFCQQCLIGKETLPYLAQWDIDIEEYFVTEGDWDSDIYLLELQQAIKEVFNIWSTEKDPDDVKVAQAMAMRSDFERIPLNIWML